jgi:hypothetical protein
MGYLKGKSALMIFDRYPDMGSKFNRHFWARGYYIATVGNISEEAIKKYIAEQEMEDRKGGQGVKLASLEAARNGLRHCPLGRACTITLLGLFSNHHLKWWS